MHPPRFEPDEYSCILSEVNAVLIDNAIERGQVKQPHSLQDFFLRHSYNLLPLTFTSPWYYHPQ